MKNKELLLIRAEKLLNMYERECKSDFSAVNQKRYENLKGFIAKKYDLVFEPNKYNILGGDGYYVTKDIHDQIKNNVDLLDEYHAWAYMEIEVKPIRDDLSIARADDSELQVEIRYWDPEDDPEDYQWWHPTKSYKGSLDDTINFVKSSEFKRDFIDTLIEASRKGIIEKE